MSNNVTLKAIGLNIQPNQLEVPPGSLSIASNVIIKRDNVVEPRRGYPLYGNALGTVSDRAKQLMTYKNRILRHFSNKLEYDSDGNGAFLPFCGTYLEPQTGRRIRYIESNGNFYFTTSNGIQKISATSASDFTTACPYITPAGGIKALDLSARLVTSPGDQTGFLPQDSAVAYRQVWGLTDANGNLILGAPSQSITVFNPLINLELSDFNRLLVSLDDVSDNTAAPSLISDGNYFSLLSLNPTSSASDLLTNLISLTEKLDLDILYADQVSIAPLQIASANILNGVCTVTFSSGNPTNYLSPGDQIFLTNFSAPSDTSTVQLLNGKQTISTLTSTTLSFNTTATANAQVINVTTIADTGVNQVTSITTVADSGGSLNSHYFYISSINTTTKIEKDFYVWFNDGTGIDPAIPGKTGIQVSYIINATANNIAAVLNGTLNSLLGDFTGTSTNNIVTITNVAPGPVPSSVDVNTAFAITTSTPGIISNLNSTYFTINSGNNTDAYYIWYSVDGIGTDPAVGGRTGIEVNLVDSDSATNVASKTASAILGATTDFRVVSSANTITITNNTAGNSNSPNAGTSGFTVVVTTFGSNATVNNARINDFQYESIAQPAAPDNPATDAELVAIQKYLQAILTQLQSEPSTGTPPTISSSSQSQFISPLDLTTSADVELTFTIPQGVTTSYFYQIYRSLVDQATDTQVLATDIAPGDELQLVFEGFPTAAQIAAGVITVLDQTPDSFAGAFLYTDETNGEGILQANDLPPFALDINKFKNVVFYANTKTRQNTTINLLGVTKLIADYNMGIIPTLTISNGIITNTYKFIIGINQIISVTTIADVAGNLAGKYFTLNNADNTVPYYVWYKVNNVGTDPAIANSTGIQVSLNTNDSANIVAEKTSNTINFYLSDFVSSVSTNVITIENVTEGSANSPTTGTSGFTVTVVTSGTGEDAALKQVLLSNVVSPGQAVDQTARSLVHVINSNPNESVYAYYLSGPSQVPGQIFLEARDLSDPKFYIVTNDSNTGSSFNPDLSPSLIISTISPSNPTVITTSTPHGLTNQDQVIITNSNSTPSIDGLYTITYINTTQFSIPVNVTVAGNRGALELATNALISDNQVLPNRIYYSKVLQPEAVPIVNTIDVGAADKAILRIFPLRDSLFVYKEDGLFRISGETAPFNLALFDTSCVLLAPDSLDVSNNLIYGWTTQGITTTSESGVNIISRPIDIDILKLATAQYTNFKTATWGVGYESDNSYTIYTVQQTDDTVATIGYRYSNLTNTFTTFDKTDTCGVINPFNDTQYLGAGDTNFIEMERKNFDRYDYADREFIQQLELNNYYGNQIQLPNITNAAIGDVIVQDQFLTVFQFNTLLGKLDTDALLSPHTYVTNNTISAGKNLRTFLDILITQIANDPGRLAQAGFTPASDYLAYKSITSSGTISNIAAGDPTVITTSSPHGLQTGRLIDIAGSNSSPSINGSFQVNVLTSTTFTIPVSVITVGNSGIFTVTNDDFLDVQASYNGIIALLNNDTGVGYSNYSPILNDTSQEAIIVNVNPLNKRITLNNALDFMVGPLTIFKAIESKIQYCPVTFGDALNLKHMREATLMFENTAFTGGTLSFSSDLVPGFIDVPFFMSGNGIFGYTGIPGTINGKPNPTGFGYNFFGGGGNSAPFRTYIPRPVQRCRYLNCQFTNNVAREKYSLFGITLTGEVGQSSRAYR